MQPDMNQLFQSMQKMQQEVVKVQKELENTIVEGTAGNGAVTVKCNGAMEFTEIKLQPEAVDPQDVETLEDLILIAVKDAMAKCQQITQEKMGKSLGDSGAGAGPMPGLPMPPSIGF